jgi:hypothetical protein
LLVLQRFDEPRANNLTRRSRNQTGEAMMPEWALSC